MNRFRLVNHSTSFDWSGNTNGRLFSFNNEGGGLPGEQRERLGQRGVDVPFTSLEEQTTTKSLHTSIIIFVIMIIVMIILNRAL